MLSRECFKLRVSNVNATPFVGKCAAMTVRGWLRMVHSIVIRTLRLKFILRNCIVFPLFYSFKFQLKFNFTFLRVQNKVAVGEGMIGDWDGLFWWRDERYIVAGLSRVRHEL
jgi:hypothetical protein